MFLFNTPSWDMLKANILEWVPEHTDTWIDFIGDVWDEGISFRNSKIMESVKSISFSLAYNPDLLALGDVSSILEWVQISPIENEAWYSSYIMSFDSLQTIAPQTNIIDLSYTRTGEETIHLNIINVNFQDNTDNTYYLSSSGIIF